MTVDPPSRRGGHKSGDHSLLDEAVGKPRLRPGDSVGPAEMRLRKGQIGSRWLGSWPPYRGDAGLCPTLAGYRLRGGWGESPGTRTKGNGLRVLTYPGTVNAYHGSGSG
jgi:hypothetical protein